MVLFLEFVNILIYSKSFAKFGWWNGNDKSAKQKLRLSAIMRLSEWKNDICMRRRQNFFRAIVSITSNKFSLKRDAAAAAAAATKTKSPAHWFDAHTAKSHNYAQEMKMRREREREKTKKNNKQLAAAAPTHQKKLSGNGFLKEINLFISMSLLRFFNYVCVCICVSVRFRRHQAKKFYVSRQRMKNVPDFILFLFLSRSSFKNDGNRTRLQKVVDSITFIYMKWPFVSSLSS